VEPDVDACDAADGEAGTQVPHRYVAGLNGDLLQSKVE